MRMMVGGVPFGRNNVGDEAILACVVRILRETRPGAEITVSTGDGPATERRLGVRAVPLFGFPHVPYRRDEMERELRGHDVFVWAGATGLSDYPESPAAMMALARAAGRRTVVWAVGMNDELNPAHYRVPPGRRRALLSLLRAATGGRVDPVAREEARRERRARAAVAAALNAADLVVVRDPESERQLRRSGVTREVIVGADSALLLEPDPAPAFNPEAAAVCAFPGPKVGFCVSAQREIADRAALRGYLDRLVADGARRILFLPMNPVTDAALMEGLRRELRHPDRAAVLTGPREPGELLAAAAAMDLVVSSRLHLLIFASIVHAPFIGISRGSKVDHFLAPYGLRAPGSVERCDFDALDAETRRLLAERPAFEARSRAVRQALLERLDRARAALDRALPA